jgi:hypothetical protein
MRMSTRVTRDIMVTKNTTDIMRTMARRVVIMMASTGVTAVAMVAAVVEVMVMVTIKATRKRHSYTITDSATQFLVSVSEDISARGVTEYVQILATLHFILLGSSNFGYC